MKNKLITEIKVGRKFTKKNSIFIKNMNSRKRRFK